MNPEQQIQTTPEAQPKPNISIQQPASKTDTLGIISLVLLFVGMQLPGFIVGLIGASKAKKEGRSPILSRLGWILNLVVGIFISIILVALVVVAYVGIQARAQDTQTKTEVLALQKFVEKYYIDHNYYPNSLKDLNLPSADIHDNNNVLYVYKTFNCSAGSQCQSYTITGKSEVSSADIKVSGSSITSNTEGSLQDSVIIEKVSKLTHIPNEKPTMATVKDITKLADQPFFKDAQNGDKVLIFTESKKAVIYRESTNEIINSGPITTTSDATAGQ